MTVELLYDAIENSIVFCVAFLIARRAFPKEHELYDSQRGISHETLKQKIRVRAAVPHVCDRTPMVPLQSLSLAAFNSSSVFRSDPARLVAGIGGATATELMARLGRSAPTTQERDERGGAQSRATE